MNDPLAIPFQLDMSPYCLNNTTNGEKTNDSEDRGVKEGTGDASSSPSVPAKSVKNDCQYELYAALLHSGNAVGGHYTSYLRTENPHDERKRLEW